MHHCLLEVKIFDDGELFVAASHMWPFFQLTENVFFVFSLQIVNNNYDTDSTRSGSEDETLEDDLGNGTTKENTPIIQEKTSHAKNTKVSH